jgi:hypothetical protein
MILGISPGTTTFGYVLVHNKKAINWGTKYFRGRWDEKKLSWIISTLSWIIDYRGVTTLAIKLPNHMPSSKAYSQMIGGINRLVEAKGLRAQYYCFEDIVDHLSPKQKISRQRMVEMLWHAYPEILAGSTIPKIICNPYYLRLFEALGVVDIALEKGGTAEH